MRYFQWGAYVSVAEKRRDAAQALTKLKKQGRSVAPVNIAGRTIAQSFWGKSWCANLERYSDFATRLPRGRSYVRNGSVIDLQIGKGEISALVSGSQLYKIKITISPVATNRWKAICRDCAGTIDSLVELLQGRLAKGVMDRVCREADGLFPAPSEIELSCSCPDWADMCKHVAAALYGVGARLDERPQLLFALRGVDETELIADAGQDLALSKSVPTTAKVLGDSDVAALFGLDMVDNAGSPVPTSTPMKPRGRVQTGKQSKILAPMKPPKKKEIGQLHFTRAERKPKRRARTAKAAKRVSR
jgi:uncharacterized Zn finger protein